MNLEANVGLPPTDHIIHQKSIVFGMVNWNFYLPSWIKILNNKLDLIFINSFIFVHLQNFLPHLVVIQKSIDVFALLERKRLLIKLPLKFDLDSDDLLPFCIYILHGGMLKFRFELYLDYSTKVKTQCTDRIECKYACFWQDSNSSFPTELNNLRALFLIIKELFVRYILVKMECFGARNTVGFSSQIESGSLPNQTHITYEGVFNEIKFDVGNKTPLVKDLHFGYARYQFSESPFDNKINDYLALFVKGNKDGEDRDGRVLNALICLDISGSMGGGLGASQNGNHKSRLQLSVEAIKMFISKLRPNDSVGIITFNHQADIILELTFKSQMPGDIYQRLDSITQKGGTTMRSGFQLSIVLLKGWIQANNTPGSENRIIMLTDVCDNSISNEKAFIQDASDTSGINLTIIGISDEFRSEVCECLKDVKGFNYFCAVNQEDIKKYVFETFDFGFFPSAYDVNITLTCDDIQSFEVFGAPDSDKVLDYNNHFKENSKNYVITKVKSTFPSEIQIIGGKVYTFGGLILLKLKRKSQNPYFRGDINLKYTDPFGKHYEQKYNLNYQFPSFEQYFSEQSLKEALEAYTFTSEMKSLLRESARLSLAESYDRFWPSISALESIIPESKVDDLKNIKKILQSSKQKKEEVKKRFWNL